MDKNKNKKKNTINIPSIKIRMMSDEEWNKLAYENYLKRHCLNANKPV